jgi:chromosome segregation ATPase
MSESIANLKNKISKLQKDHDAMMTKHQLTLLDFKKVKLQLQEERLKYKTQIASLKQKVSLFGSELDKLKHKVTLSHTEYQDICKQREEAEKELDQLYKKFPNLKSKL